MPSTSILSLLISEHRSVAKLFAALDKTSGRSVRRRKELYAEIDRALTVHADFEEMRIYPLLKARKGSKDMALEAFEEHAQIKRLLGELRGLGPEDERWMAKVKVLAEDFRHHMKEEEKQAFPQLSRLAKPAVLEDLAEEYQVFKDAGPLRDKSVQAAPRQALVEVC